MLVTDFDFALPDDLIAQTALPRGQSRLLALDRASGALTHRAIADLPSLLRPGDLLVVNNTRVFAARLLGHRVPSGGAVECLLLSESSGVRPGLRVRAVGGPDAPRPEAQAGRRSSGSTGRRAC